MRLIDIKIDGFGKLTDRYIAFSDGINLVTGHNEAGKSTLHACIRAMFYGMERKKGVASLTDTYSHFKPWNGKKYGAVMRVEYEGKTYSIKRNFYNDPVACTVYDETDREAVPFAEGLIKNMLCGMTADAYDNTISIGQLKSSADEAMAKELKQYIVNMDTTGNRSLNCEKAKKYLADQKSALAEEICSEAARRLAANQSEIRNIEKEIAKPEFVSRINELEEKIKESGQKIKAKTAEAEVLGEGISADRNKLTECGIETSSQVGKAERRFEELLNDYETEKKEQYVSRYRMFYIISLGIALLALAIDIYLYSKSIMTGYSFVFGILFAAGAIAGIVFLILCIDAKGRLGRKKKVLADFLKEHSGSEEITDSNIEGVKSKLKESKTLALDVEAREKQLAELTAESADISQQDAAFNQDLSGQKANQTELMIKLKRLNELKKENEELKTGIRKNDEINNNLEAIDIAINTIDELSVKLKNSLGVFMNKEASEYVKKITGGAYDSLSIDDDMEVYLNTAEKMVPIEQLSSGTADQVYMALRIAGARLIQNGKDKLPLIFDDSFVNYDENRLYETLRWVADEYDGQIVVFSCHRREGRIMEKEGIAFNRIDL